MIYFICGMSFVLSVIAFGSLYWVLKEWKAVKDNFECLEPVLQAMREQVAVIETKFTNTQDPRDMDEFQASVVEAIDAVETKVDQLQTVVTGLQMLRR